jgi:hypothetical protein
MLDYNVDEKWIRKDSWVKDLLKTYNPEQLAELIEKRIDRPNFVGPYPRYSQNETSTDIIDAFIASDLPLRNRIASAIGFIIYNILHGKKTVNHNILPSVFSIISNSQLIECRLLLARWLEANKNKINNDSTNWDKSQWEKTYREAMMAFARIQEKDDLTEMYWLNLWRSDTSFAWAAAFMGLRIQNPLAACNELHLLIERKLDKAQYLMVGMWRDNNAKEPLINTLKNSIKSDQGWGGLVLNTILSQLNSEEKTEAMSCFKMERS